MRNLFFLPIAFLALCSSVAGQNGTRQTSQKVTFHPASGKLAIRIGGRPFATYVYKDEKIPRPFFAHVHAPGGIQVTRNHPPKMDDLQDHASYHPGVWMAFGDINGNDYWRLKAKIAHAGFTGLPTSKNGFGAFKVRHTYFSEDGDTKICEELCQIEIVPTNAGYLMLWNSSFTSERDDFYFGDQEEMGLGVRVATPIAVNRKKGGKILNSDGDINERQVWGKQAKWCDYSGVLNGKRVGVTLMPHPDNFRASWFHARDYGLLLANPFGRKAFTRDKASKVVVKKGNSLRLRYGLFFHSRPRDAGYDPDNVYKVYLKLAGGK